MKNTPSIAERYISATNTKDLTVKAEQRNAADMMIAARMTPGVLGNALRRLHGEWDAAAKPRNITHTDATMLYGRLKSLQTVLGALCDYLVRKGEQNPLVAAKAIVMYWLDDRCQPCNGVGAKVIPGTPTLGNRCRSCGGSGKRPVPYGSTGKITLAYMDAAAAESLQSMKRRLRN